MIINELIPDDLERRMLELQAERDRYRYAIERALKQVEFGLGRVVRELRAALDAPKES